MREGALQYLAEVMRGLTAGAEPARLLDDTLTGAVAAVGGRNAVVVGVVEGVAAPIAAAGTSPRVVMQAAEECIATGRTARRRDPATGAGAVAHPIRMAGRVIGGLAVGGDPVALDAAPLPLFADAASLALARRPSLATTSVSDFSRELLEVGSDLDGTAALARAFDAALRLFGALGGFCVVPDGGGWRVAHYRNISAEALRNAAREPEFKSLVATAGLRVAPATHPVVAALGGGSAVAVATPLVAPGRRLGFLLLLLGEEPGAAETALIQAFSEQLAVILRSCEQEQRVEDEAQRLAAAVHASPAAVLVLDEDLRVALVNGAAAELLHLPEAFAVGHPVDGRLGSEDLEALVRAGRDGTSELALGSPPDRLHRVSVRSMRARDGRPLGRMVVLEDLTTERETEQMKRDFAAVIGHELRTPLTVIKGYVKMLGMKREAIDAASLDSCIGALSTNTSKLERLIDDLLFVSSIETTPPALELEPVDVADVVDGFAGGRVTVHRPAGAIPLSADRPKVAQILHHLLDNALKYSDGEVVVTVVDGDEEVEVRVDDTGPGIYSGDLQQLFDRFRQLDGSATRPQGGTGVGLYICRRLVELQGGRIWCESRLGVGSRFAFTLPKHVTVRSKSA